MGAKTNERVDVNEATAEASFLCFLFFWSFHLNNKYFKGPVGDVDSPLGVVVLRCVYITTNYPLEQHRLVLARTEPPLSKQHMRYMDDVMWQCDPCIANRSADKQVAGQQHKRLWCHLLLPPPVLQIAEFVFPEVPSTGCSINYFHRQQQHHITPGLGWLFWKPREGSWQAVTGNFCPHSQRSEVRYRGHAGYLFIIGTLDIFKLEVSG